jgi:preprotein translocase subunit SecD
MSSSLRDAVGSARNNWRLVLLAVLVVASSVALFPPGASGGDAGANETRSESLTNLQYGIELSGGTRVRAPLVGMTAEGVDFSGENPNEVERAVARELNVSLSDVKSRPGEGAIELYRKSDNVSHDEFRSAVEAVGLEPSRVRDGVTEPTRQNAVDVLNRKINEGGLTGGQATIARSATGERFIVVEVPNANRSEVLDIVRGRGTVELVALYPDGNGSFERERLLEQDEMEVDTARSGESGEAPYVPVTLNGSAAERFATTMRQQGFTSQEGVGNCDYVLGEGPQDSSEYCLLTVTDGEVVYASSMGNDLAQIINNEEFVSSPAFRILAPSVERAQELELNLRAGALPTSLAVEEGTINDTRPSLAQEFKLFSLVTGFVAMLAVAGVVFLRYREPGVAAPMLLTAAAEVYLMLGFAAAIGLALDLSHIAGLIAVVGTGVDDLVIIADEILQGGEIRTGKVFQSRFRKAFWVIGAAAATTIIAMSPLAVLSLGDLQGFAIVTIVGVLLGVLVTRPAYGNILRNVVLD